jgi:predicted Zn-dependent peptidase
MVDSPVSPQELDKAIGSLSGQRILADETSSAEAQRIASLSALGLYETVEQFQAGVRAVTIEDVQRVARRYLSGGHYIVVIQPAS